jgi:hypothetical protein
MKRILRGIIPILDLILLALLVPSALVMKAFRRIGAGRLPLSRRLLFAIGIFPISDHYYEPGFHPRNYTSKLLQKRELPGLVLDIKKQNTFLKDINRNDELLSKKWFANHPRKFQIDNGSFEAGDADLYYLMIRHFKPARIIEIGSGQSTLVAIEALKENKNEGRAGFITCVEPYENLWLEDLGITIIRERIESLDPIEFYSLEEDDILFIDSSHVIRPEGDVTYLIQEVLPSLKPGVIVHFHDIYTPRHYPSKAVLQEVRFWNEQYLLEAFLTNNSEWEILVTLNFYVSESRLDANLNLPYLRDRNNPASFYIRKIN